MIVCCKRAADRSVEDFRDWHRTTVASVASQLPGLIRLVESTTSAALCPSSRKRLVNGDDEIADGVKVLVTPGHPAGHRSVPIEARDEFVVVGGQLAWAAGEIEAEVASRANVDPVAEVQAAAVNSIRRIKALHPRVIYLSRCNAHHPIGQPPPTAQP